MNGVTCVKGQELILAASADTSVHMFNYKGGLVGTFGLHEWILDDVSTHQDPDAENTMPVLDAVEALCSVAAAREALPGAPGRPCARDTSMHQIAHHEGNGEAAPQGATP